MVSFKPAFQLQRKLTSDERKQSDVHDGYARVSTRRQHGASAENVD